MQRIHDIYRPTDERKCDWREVERMLSDEELKEQTSRCLNCGQPFCHAYGCPLGNFVPDQNRAVAQGDWKRAYALLTMNSDFPEFTSRICPALCEASCVHQLDEESVMVRQSEKRLMHRGATGNDPETGDGAGLLMKIPHGFFRKIIAGIVSDNRPQTSKPEAGSLKSEVPGDIGVPGIAMIFGGEGEEEKIENIVLTEGCEVIGWRDVPTNPDAIGHDARKVMPRIRQLFIGTSDSGLQPSEVLSQESEVLALERRLYVIRRQIEKATSRTYVCSCSARTVVYKGLLLATQIEAFYPDLSDSDFVSPFAIVHQRYSTNTFPSWELAHPFRAIAHNGEINALKGNLNALAAREPSLRWPDAACSAIASCQVDIKKILPIVHGGQSDSASLDNMFELLVMAGRDAPHAKPGTTLISPPPHHDIYSIEDLSQLIYDLKCANPEARVSVKLVSEAGGRTDLLKAKEGSKFDFGDVLADFSTQRRKDAECAEGEGDDDFLRLCDSALMSNYDSRELIPAVDGGEVTLERTISNCDRSVGAALSGWLVARRASGPDGLAVNFTGVAGQSFGAFLANGITFRLRGAANVIAYGATSGAIFINGLAGERFGIRNSGATLVVEGVGDHGCEYMTGGIVAILGSVGVNFAAGMTGGVAYVYDESGDLDLSCNLDSVDLFPVKKGSADEKTLLELLEEHIKRTGSPKAKRLVGDWANTRPYFTKVQPASWK